MGATSELRSRRRKWAISGRFRFTVASKLMVGFAAAAALSAALAMALQDRSLAADLERAAQERLARAAQSASELVDLHLDAMLERYRAISGTPQLRANLEVDHAPTLAFYAESLAQREGAELLAFYDRDDQPVAVVGPRELLEAAARVPSAGLVAVAGQVYAVVSNDLHFSSGPVGRVVAAEPITQKLLARWAELSGVDVGFASPDATEADALSRKARSIGDVDLYARVSLKPERAALRRSRINLLAAGTIAVALSIVACAMLARGFVRPILAIQNAADRIRAGDLEVRLASDRRDEIGDVARTFDRMLDDLDASRRANDRHVLDLQKSEHHLAKAQEMARLGSFQLDFEKDELASMEGSEQLRTMLQSGLDGEELDPLQMLSRVHPDDREDLIAAVLATLDGGHDMRADFRLQLPDGSEKIVHAQAQLGGDPPEGVQRLEGTVQDVTDRRRAEEQIRFLAQHDALTGLGNRVLFAERLEMAIEQGRRRGRRLGVLILGLDHFKRINDTLGQQGGDEVLRNVADRLVRSLRDSDVVARHSGLDFAIARVAGDEFTLLVNDIGDPQDLTFVAKRALSALSQPLEVCGQELVLSASAGIASWPTDGLEVDSLLRSAGSAMQHAKERGGGEYQFYDESMNIVATAVLDLESRIRRALANDEFEMYYQPKVNLEDGRVSGFEALIRWRDPNEGLLSPGHFIPVAEQCGLIMGIGGFALREVCRQIAAWERAAAGGTVPCVAVNLSAHQFKSGTLVKTVAEILEESGIDPGHLELEITETAVLHDEKRVVQDLEHLRGIGISISLDDFGTGQSSLSHLRRLPVDTLKIDMSFVRNIARSEADARLTAAIVALGRARGLCVVAEGVETPEQRRMLAAWGCDAIQGYLISPAVPAEDAIALTRRVWADAGPAPAAS